jgi:hypothetical protein
VCGVRELSARQQPPNNSESISPGNGFTTRPHISPPNRDREISGRPAMHRPCSQVATRLAGAWPPAWALAQVSRSAAASRKRSWQRCRYRKTRNGPSSSCRCPRSAPSRASPPPVRSRRNSIVLLHRDRKTSSMDGRDDLAGVRRRLVRAATRHRPVRRLVRRRIIKSAAAGPGVPRFAEGEGALRARHTVSSRAQACERACRHNEMSCSDQSPAPASDSQRNQSYPGNYLPQQPARDTAAS